MKQFFSYWFWPNPAGWQYGDQKVMALLAVCAGLVVASFLIRVWRSKLENGMTRTLTKSWPSFTFWFGVVGLVLVVSRVEMIQFIEMRALWVVWFLIGALFLAFQVVSFRRRHYVVVKQAHIVDEREKYLPKRKK